jgi:hypothetical protein
MGGDEFKARIGGPQDRRPPVVGAGADPAGPVHHVQAGQFVQADDAPPDARVRGGNPGFGLEVPQVHDVQGRRESPICRSEPAQSGADLMLPDQ